MYCSKCGRQIPQDSKMCPYCGAKMVNNVKPKKPTKVWKTFNNVGYGLSIAGLVLFWFPILGLSLSIPGFVFACLGKKDEENRQKQKIAYGCGLAGIILGVLVFLFLIIGLPLILAFCIK